MNQVDHMLTFRLERIETHLSRIALALELISKSDDDEPEMMDCE